MDGLISPTKATSSQMRLLSSRRGSSQPRAMTPELCLKR